MNANRHVRLFFGLLLCLAMIVFSTFVGGLVSVVLAFVNGYALCMLSSSFCNSSGANGLFLFLWGSGPVLGFIVGLFWSKALLTEID